MLVAVELREQQIHPGVDQGQVCSKAETLERRPVLPERQQAHHHRQRRNLPNLHAHVEAQNAQQHGCVVVTQWQLLKARRQAKPM